MVTPPRTLMEATHSSGLHLWLGVALKIGIVDRESGGSILLPAGELIQWSEVVRLYDGADVPNGTPFLVPDNGDMRSVHFTNCYLLDAARQDAYRSNGLIKHHVPVLRRLLTFLRERHGVVDLTAATRADLVAYRDHRRPGLAPTSWNGELSILGGFYRYAKTSGWIESDPVSRWGSRQRNTLRDRVNEHRRERFLIGWHLGGQKAADQIRPSRST